MAEYYVWPFHRKAEVVNESFIKTDDQIIWSWKHKFRCWDIVKTETLWTCSLTSSVIETDGFGINVQQLKNPQFLIENIFHE